MPCALRKLPDKGMYTQFEGRSFVDKNTQHLWSNVAHEGGCCRFPTLPFARMPGDRVLMVLTLPWMPHRLPTSLSSFLP